ncbi:MAG: ATP synthase F1 subunit delta [Roseiflexaceae bacterium]|nr:ATP synthase F1 subunit delta [Roseiflexaceae bacterium]
MSTSEAQVMARALYDSVMSTTLDSLRTAASKLASGGTSVTPARVDEVLPGASTPVRNFVLLLAQDGQLGALAQVTQAFEQYAAAQNSRLPAEVISATVLDAAQHARVVDQLHASYGDRLELTFSVDPSILGGLVIRIGDQVFDNSARSRLSAVQRSLLSS